MSINVFEGARRITKLISVIWIVGWSIYAFNYNPYIDQYFRVDSPGSVPIRMDDPKNRCNEEDATEYLHSQYTKKGTAFDATLCFKPEIFEDGRKLIPIWGEYFIGVDQLAEWIVANKDKKGTPKFEAVTAAYKKATQEDNNNKKTKKWLLTHGAEEYSTEVRDYTKKVADIFKLSKADEEWIDGKVWSSRLEDIKEVAPMIMECLAFLWIFSWCVGWIVRGFAGIPSGHDSKPDDK
ncbi:hypothetical protein [Methylovulum psychrotolerans]|uniref:Uncharacterized protein n=1 Tax=Methylovulum psychrotolerans TaxID=1704499 RepID=A0A1Z4C2W0_9GAMM|nr:hypothetical protein [Methylovulum psychrotolerans]ASF47845.1 hypothetical protein CEK71_18210 [Methylovulum psychrotolerans]